MRYATSDDERCTFHNALGGRCLLVYGHHYEHRLEASIR